MSNHHVVDDLGAYVLGNLSGEQARAVRVHLEGCPHCREELERVQGGAELLDSARFAREPPTDLEERIFTALGRDPGRGRRRARLAGGILVAAACVAVVFVAGWAVGRRTAAALRPDQVVTLAGPGGASGSARLSVLPTGTRRIELSVRGLAPLPPGMAWDVYFDDKRGHRRPAGSFLTDTRGGADVVLAVGASSADYTSIVVTRSDGSGVTALMGDLQP